MIVNIENYGRENKDFSLIAESWNVEGENGFCENCGHSRVNKAMKIVQSSGYKTNPYVNVLLLNLI